MFTNLVKRLYKNQIVTFGHIGHQTFTDSQKEHLTDSFINYAKSICPNEKLQFDPDGIRIGLSKGAAPIGEKGLKNRIEKFGISNLTSLYIQAPQKKHVFYWSILPKLNNREAHFYTCVTWPYEGLLPEKETIAYFSFLDSFSAIEYGYYQKVSKSVSDIGGWKHGLLGTSTTIKEDWNWSHNIHTVKEGVIKSTYPINYLNQRQYELNHHLFQNANLMSSNHHWICKT